MLSSLRVRLSPWSAFYRQADHGINLGAGIISCAGTIWGSDTIWPQIQAQATLLNVSEFHLALDAGASYEVMAAVSRLQRKCFENGYRLKIIWYGQFEKADGDIDELSIPADYKLLSLGELQSLIRQRETEFREGRQAQKAHRSAARG